MEHWRVLSRRVLPEAYIVLIKCCNTLVLLHFHVALPSVYHPWFHASQTEDSFKIIKFPNILCPFVIVMGRAQEAAVSLGTD